MRLRLLPVLITIAVSASVLFGGWFIYRSVAMEDPLIQRISEIEGVADPMIDIGNDQAELHVQLEQDARLAEVYPALEEIASDSLGSRNIKITIDDEASGNLDDWWSQALFDVAQAMDTMQYSNIPERLREFAQTQGSEVTVVSEIDDRNVYITLRDGQSSKYVVLPRRSVMGVWPDE